MERLTARNKRFPKEAYYPYCFRNDTCNGQGPSDKCDMCPLPYHICETLADYEDTGLTPAEIRELAERDTAKAPVDTDDEFDMYVCPSCNMAIGTIGDKRNHHFCLNCGQRLKFKEDIQ